MAGVAVQVIYDPDGANADITSYVVFRTAQLQSSVGAQAGLWSCTVKDPGQTLSFTTGKRVLWKLDGTTFYGGFLTQVGRTFAIPADNTAVPSQVKTRQFVLRGVDYNILFDKRVLRRPANYTAQIPNVSRQWDSQLISTLCSSYLDLEAWVNYAAEVSAVAQLPRKVGEMFRWTQQGSAWRQQMNIFAQMSGAVYYLKASGNNANLVYKAQEATTAPYVLSDSPAGAEEGFRDLDYLEDATGMVNDALVWGGNEFTPSGAGVIFSRETNASSVTAHNRWQWAETHFGETNFASQEALDDRAEAIVLGRTGDTIYDKNRGLQEPNRSYTITWHQRNVPKVGGLYQFIRPGDLTTLKLHVFGDGVDPLVEVLPCRSISVSFPDNDPTGQSHVRFQGTFSIQTNDPYTLWLAMRRVRNSVLQST